MVYDFMMQKMSKISDVNLQLRAETKEKFSDLAKMLSAPDQCEHMKFIIKAAGFKRGIEIGVFTGYSALCLAEGMPSDGKLLSLDVNDQYTNIAKKYWQLAGVNDKIELRLGNAVEILDKLISDQRNLESFDFGFIDADKPNYPNYFERLNKLIRKGGIVMIDNIIWGELIAREDHSQNDLETRGIYDTSQLALNNKEFDFHTIMIGNGLLIAHKKI
ncbi:sam-dependent methyltransferase [Stylonychia lemnae]|uniref:Sam-dependent methyltransferase n=1 Tax=Stylonychia lemnae TaxID=5949 RepID=A0A078A393_STYLE|nr:sam-dependent methyltransferase [Stylonychia lemnae]|eukprot:CDW75234.1 sam-dependent methyltransferase [Stylonychia lemnae]